MKKGDLVHFRKSGEFFDEVGLIVEIQTRGPVPGAYVLWPKNDSPEWIKIESLKVATTSRQHTQV